MGKFTGIILVSDFDGTFYGGVKESREKNVAEVERFKSGGGLFTFATGRDYHSLLAIEPNFKEITNAPVIMANGARLYDTDKKEYIFSYTLNMTLFEEFLDIIYKKYPDIGIRFSCENGLVTPVLNDILKEDLKDIHMKTTPVREMPVKELIESGEKVYKCVMVHNPEIIDRVHKIAGDINKSKGENSREIYFTKTYARGLEAVNKDASKGASALRLKEYLKVRDNREYRVFAIGDYDNDVDMIKFADVGAATANALEHVKKVAQVQTAGCDDGAVADFIKIIEREYI